MKIFKTICNLLLLLIIYFVLPSDGKITYAVYILFYIYQITYLIKNDIKSNQGKYSVFNFNTLFFTMYTLVTYTIPFLYFIGLKDFVITTVVYSDNYISKALFISSLAVESYTYGYFKGIKRPTCAISYKALHRIKLYLTISNVMAVLATGYFLYKMVAVRNSEAMDIDGVLNTIIVCLIILPLAFAGYSNKKYQLSLVKFLKKHIVIFSCTSIIVASMLLIGDRMLPLVLLTAVVFIINEYVWKFKIQHFLLGVVGGIFFMFLIGYTRHNVEGVSISQGIKLFTQTEDNKLSMFQDIIPINADLFLGAELVEKKGYYKPAKIIPILLAPIPYLPSLIKSEYFNNEIESGMYLTMYNRSILGRHTEGIGTHITIDIYLSWGILGVIVIFLIFGQIVGTFFIKRDNLFYAIAFIALISWAIYMPRETINVPYRNIVWMTIIAHLIARHRN